MGNIQADTIGATFRNYLKRKKRLKVTVKLSATRGTATTRKNVVVTLRPPRR